MKLDIPQSPYLMDDTIENNILFGRNLKTKKYINNSIKLSQIENLFQLPKGLKTVGNNGSRLSGGQNKECNYLNLS